MRRFALSSLAALALAGCSLLIGDGFSGEEGPGNGGLDAAQDGIAPGSDANGGDSNVGPDGTVIPDGGPSFDPCALPISMCDDFERATAKGDWTSEGIGGDGTLAIIPAATGTGKRLESKITTAGGDATLARTFSEVDAGKPSHVHYEATFDFPAFPTAGGVYMAGIDFFGTGRESGSILYFLASGSTVQFIQQIPAVGGQYVSQAVAIGAGAPHRVVLDLRFNGQVKITVDGVTALDRPAETFLISHKPGVRVGASGGGNGGAQFTLRVDDVVFYAD